MPSGLVGEIDRDHPGYQRTCIFPRCPAAFNILDAMISEGYQGSQRGWKHAPRPFLGYACPAHAPLVLAHVAAWIRVGDRVTGCRCACGGWTWFPATPVTLGAYTRRWLRHLERTPI